MFYSLNPWGDPTNTAVNSFPYSLGSSNASTSTGTVFGSVANQYFGNQFSLSGTDTITGTNILFVPYTTSTGQQLGAIKFFLYSPFTTNTYIYTQSGPTGNLTLTGVKSISPATTIPYSGYTGYLYAYYDATNTDIAKSPSTFASVALPNGSDNTTGYTPFLFDSQNFPSSNGSVPSGDNCFQTWSATNNVSTTMTNPITSTTYTLFGAVPISFASANTNLTYTSLNTSGNLQEGTTSTETTLELQGTTVTAEGQYLGTSTYTYTTGTNQSAIGGTPFCSGTLIVGSYLNDTSLSSFFGTSNLTTSQQTL
jgi:hypothetical protein